MLRKLLAIKIEKGCMTVQRVQLLPPEFWVWITILCNFVCIPHDRMGFFCFLWFPSTAKNMQSDRLAMCELGWYICSVDVSNCVGNTTSDLLHFTQIPQWIILLLILLLLRLSWASVFFSLRAGGKQSKSFPRISRSG